MILSALLVINSIHHVSGLRSCEIAHKVRHAHVIYTGIPFDWRVQELVSHLNCRARPEKERDPEFQITHIGSCYRATRMLRHDGRDDEWN